MGVNAIIPGEPARLPGAVNLNRYAAMAVLRGMASATSIVLWVVFLQQQHGLTLTQVTLLDLPFWVGKFLFELPTGVVADRYGRKLSLIISMAMASAIWLVFAISNSFWMLAAAQFVGALGATFSSGADEALLFESVKAGGRQAEYARLSGQMRAIETASAMLFGLVVGVVAERNILLPVLFTAALYALTIIPIQMMQETAPGMIKHPEYISPGRSKEDVTDRAAATALSGYAQIVRRAFSALRDFSALRWAVAYLVVLSCVGFYASVFLQPYVLALNLPVSALGPIMVLVQLMGIAGSLAVPRAQRMFGNAAILYGAPVLIVVCLIAAGLLPSIPILAVVILAALLFALAQPVLLAVVQDHAPNSVRATLLSIQSLLATVFLIVTEPGLGVISDRFGVAYSYLGMAVLIVLFLLPLALHREWKRQ